MSNTPDTPTSKSGFSPVALLRKTGPYLLFLLLGIVMLYGQQLVLTLTALVHGAGLNPHPGDATGAEVAAVAQASGWPAFGLVTGKLITAAGAYLFFTIVPWLVQHLTHPKPTQWAKSDYGPEFLKLAPWIQFEVYQRLQLNIVLRVAAALLFAALVQ